MLSELFQIRFGTNEESSTAKMAPGLKNLFKREAPAEEEVIEEDVEIQEEVTTLGTVHFGKHLHKVKITSSTIATTTLEGKRNS